MPNVSERNFSLYCDGKLVPVEPARVNVAPDGSVSVMFITAEDCLDNASTTPREAVAWGGFTKGQYRYLVQKHADPSKSYPDMGFVQLQSVEVPEDPQAQPIFVVMAVSPVYDWAADKSVADAGQEVRIPAEWFVNGRNEE